MEFKFLFIGFADVVCLLDISTKQSAEKHSRPLNGTQAIIGPVVITLFLRKKKKKKNIML